MTTTPHAELDTLQREVFLSSAQWVSGVTQLAGIGYRPTAASAYCAGVLLQNYQFEPLPPCRRMPGCQFEPTSKNLAILLDVCTSLHYAPDSLAVAKDLLRDIQEETRAANYYGTMTREQVDAIQAQATGSRADRVFALLHNVALLHDRMPTYGNGAGLGGSTWRLNQHGDMRMTGYRATAAAIGVAQVLLRLFRLEPKRTWQSDQQHVALLVDACASVHYLPQDLADAKRIMQEIRDDVREADPVGLLQPAEVSRATQTATAKRAARIFTILTKATLLHDRLPSYGR